MLEIRVEEVEAEKSGMEKASPQVSISSLAADVEDKDWRVAEDEAEAGEGGRAADELSIPIDASVDVSNRRGLLISIPSILGEVRSSA